MRVYDTSSEGDRSSCCDLADDLGLMLYLSFYEFIRICAPGKGRGQKGAPLVCRCGVDALTIKNDERICARPYGQVSSRMPPARAIYKIRAGKSFGRTDVKRPLEGPCE